jgi:long-subunit fatty acid transport protein
VGCNWLHLKPSTEELDWKDSWAYSVGADWKMQPGLTLRAGLGIDKTPVSDHHRSVRVPSEDRTVLSVGYELRALMTKCRLMPLICI